MLAFALSRHAPDIRWTECRSLAIMLGTYDGATRRTPLTNQSRIGGATAMADPKSTASLPEGIHRGNFAELLRELAVRRAKGDAA